MEKRENIYDKDINKITTADNRTYINFNYTYEGTNGIFINTNTISGKVYIVLNFLCFLYYIIPLIWIVKYRNWYIFKQRNFILTFIGGIANYISTASNSLTPIIKIPCSFAYYSATIATSIMQICYVFRAFRLILLYRLNIFKVTYINENKFIKNLKEGTLIEPNIYYKSIYKLVNKKLAWITLTVIETVVTIAAVSLHLVAYAKHGPICGITPVDINSKINSEPHGYEFINKYNLTSDFRKLPDVSTFYYMKSMFRLPDFLTFLFITVCIVITVIFATTEIKDSKTFGIKFDCLSSAIISIMVGVVYFFFKFQMETIMNGVKPKTEEKTIFTKQQMYLRTKQGIIFFVIIGVFIQLTSVIIPLIQCVFTEHMNKKYESEPINELQYFYKVIKQPELVEELKAIAIQEFCVENVLFWENYCLLHKLVTRVTKHHKEVGGTIDNYDLFSLQDIMYNENSTFSIEQQSDGSYDPEYPLLPQLVPYFNSFYYTFIDIDGPAPVNITAYTITRINYELNTEPTVGIFDEALSEVIENMFFSIYPIFLNQNRKQIGEIYDKEI